MEMKTQRGASGVFRRSASGFCDQAGQTVCGLPKPTSDGFVKPGASWVLITLILVALFTGLQLFMARPVRAGALPPGWQAVDIEGSGGSATFDVATGSFIITGSGEGIEKDAAPDSFYFVYMNVPNGATMTARIRYLSVPDDASKTKAGVMFRENLNPYSAMICEYVLPGPSVDAPGSVGCIYRADKPVVGDGSVTTLVKTGAGPGAVTVNPYWVRVDKIMNSSMFKGYGRHSADGETWVNSNTTKYPKNGFSRVTPIGFAVATECTVAIDKVKIWSTKSATPTNNAFADSLPDSTIVFDSDTIKPPSAPTNLFATGGPGKAELFFEPVADATSYTVKAGTSSGQYTMSEEITDPDPAAAILTYTYTGLADNTQYYFVVTASNGYGESAASNEVRVTPNAGLQVPAVPTITGATPGDASATISWKTVKGATRYRIKAGTTSGLYTTQQDATGIPQDVEEASYLFTGLENGTEYYFVVSAVNDAGESANSAAMSATPLATPTTPLKLVASAADGKVNLAWDESPTDSASPTGSVTYSVKVSDSPDGPFSALVSGITSTHYAHKRLTNGQTYYYKVVAVNSYGMESPGTPVVSATPTLDVPKLIRGLVVYDKTLISDTGNTHADSWSIQKDLQEGVAYSGDRAFLLTSVPESYRGAEWIRTAVDSKIYQGSPLAAFYTGEDVVVILAVDSRISQEAFSGIQGWRHIEGDHLVDDATNPQVTFDLYAKTFKAGERVTLDSVNNSSSVGYFVIVMPALVDVDQTDTIVNDGRFTLTGQLKADAGLEIYDNGREVGSIAAASQDRPFSAEINLSEGLNKIEVRGVGPTGVVDSRYLSVTYDSEAPLITITSPELVAKVVDPEYTLQGYVSERAEVTVRLNGTTVLDGVDKDAGAAFRKDLFFTEGMNTLEISAQDTAGNVNTLTYDIEYRFGVKDLVFRDASGNPITTLTPSTDIIASMSVTNKTSETQGVTLFVVLYDPEGKTKRYTYSSYDVAPGATKSLSSALRLPDDIDGCTAKAFVCDSPTGQNLLSEELELKCSIAMGAAVVDGAAMDGPVMDYLGMNSAIMNGD